MSIHLKKYVLIALAGGAGAFLVACGGSDDDSTAPTVQVLSSKPEYVTGGDALVAIKPAAATAGAAIAASLNGADVASVFKPDPANPGTFVGLLSGLKDGANAFVTSSGGSSISLTLTNYPRSGPVLSGPHLQPYVCMTDKFFLPDGTTLGAATDDKCSAPSKVMYAYKTTGNIFKALPNLQTLPADVASTTIVGGTVVPYVIRFEAGTIDRGVYNIAILHDPTKEAVPTATAPPKGWNKRISYVHGYGCVGGWYYQGNATGVSVLDLYDIPKYLAEGVLVTKPRPADLAASFNVLSDTWLSKGYAVVTNTLNHPSISCNPHLAGEATMMTKEYFVERYGTPLFTISTGGSGGAYTSLQIADAFPGLFDGVSISSTFPDALSLGLAGLHAHLLFHYWSDLSPGTLTDAQKIAISGYQGVTAQLDSANQSARTDPTSGRKISWSSAYTSGQWTVVGGAYPQVEAVPANLRWDALTNPKGARASVFDVGRNVYGVDASGYALRPFDNVGLQYGLNALNAGAITRAQFLDLNEKMGGVDNNGNFTTSRSTANADALRRVYQSGVNLGGNGGLASIPIFDNGASTESGGYHYGWFHYAVRDRLRAANGNSDNFVMWRGTFPAATATDLFERWMVAYTADKSTDSQRAKVLKAKPADGVEGCWDRSTPPKFIAENLTFSSKPDSQCTTLWPVYSNTLKEAGGPLAANVLKCQLKAVDTRDYTVTFTATELTRLNAVFPTGVCDWSRPGVNQTGVLPYASFGPSAVNKVFDITAP
jgi:hypothetical protein